jgi:hypothetical protein
MAQSRRPVSADRQTMHLRQSRTRSIAALSGLLLYAFTTFAAPLADAREHADTGATEVHIESGTGAPCAPAHDHANCAFCRYQSSTVVEAPEAISVPASTASVTRLISHNIERLPGSFPCIPVGSRAPPTLI